MPLWYTLLHVVLLSFTTAWAAEVDIPTCDGDVHEGTHSLVQNRVHRLKPESLSQRSWRFKGSKDANDSPDMYDMHGRVCILCDMPYPERTKSGKKYVQRSDCGNQSVLEHSSEVMNKPLIQFSRPASEGHHNQTDAWCELNMQKVCADTVYNKDALMQAKSLNLSDSPSSAKYDFHYCLHNGWLSDEVRALQNDFDGMKKKAEEFCNSRDDGWNTTMTMAEWMVVYEKGIQRGIPTPEEARYVGSWACAMGTPLCDMGYCAYTYCPRGDGSFGLYQECEGWDPVKGMPLQGK